MSPALPATSVSDRDRAARCRRLLDEARAELRQGHEAGLGGEVTARRWAEAADALVRELFREAQGRHPGLEVALVAVGGYGRLELCPHSDLDLWLLLPSDGGDAARAQELAETLLYPLWDAKLQVGHAVRTVGDVLALAQGDLSACTALLDARLVDGSQAIWEELGRGVPRLLERDVNRVVRLLTEEKRQRHARFGDTVYLLEPNVKNGEGGYRDLMVGLWAAKARFRVRDFADLVRLGQASERQVAALVAAHCFYLQLRTAAHLFAGRQQDRLTFELQEAIAPRLFPHPPPPTNEALEQAVAPSVEALMQQYFLHAKSVTRQVDRLLSRCLIELPRPPVVRTIDSSFALFNGKLSLRDPEIFRRRPSEMLRLFNVALELGAEIYGHTKDLIAEQVGEGRLAGDADAAREFLRLLLDDRDAKTPSLLEEAHGLGLVAAVMPEFAPCTGRVQHDLYHVFTVDQHQLYAVARLKAIARGELAAELPAPTEVMRQVKRRLPLYLGTLLHDVGKPLGKGHSETGARLAQAIGTRFGLSEEEIAATEFLVRKHLLLSHLSQRRDLDDVAMIANLAEELHDEETLRELYLLTVADMSMVAPGNLTEWKEQLLRELYTRTLAYYRQGPELKGADQGELVARRKRRVAELMGVEEATLAGWFASLPERYVTSTPPKQIVREMALSRRRQGPVAVEVAHRPRGAASELTVCADDAPGLLAKITGVLLAHRIDVLSARIDTREADGRVIEAIDKFATRDRYGRAITDETRWQAVEADLAEVLSGRSDVEAVIAGRRESSSLPERVVPKVPTEVKVDNEVSGDCTVLDVFTQDRLGVLYTITKTLAALALDIRLSKVATEAARVADVFYVRDREGRKLIRARAEEVAATLRQALERLVATRGGRA